jgi:tRNA(fMet)-specific endonuclease VapC
VTLAELQYGVAKSASPERNQQALDAFTLPLEVVPFDVAAAVTFGPSEPPWSGGEPRLGLWTC